MKARFIAPALCLLLWGCLALHTSADTFSSPEQRYYYFVIPLLMTGASLGILLLMFLRFGFVRFLALALSVFGLLALLPYLLAYAGGM